MDESRPLDLTIHPSKGIIRKLKRQELREVSFFQIR